VIFIHNIHTMTVLLFMLLFKPVCRSSGQVILGVRHRLLYFIFQWVWVCYLPWHKQVVLSTRTLPSFAFTNSVDSDYYCGMTSHKSNIPAYRFHFMKHYHMCLSSRFQQNIWHNVQAHHLFSNVLDSLTEFLSHDG